MSKKEFLDELIINWNDPTFIYGGKQCGISSEVHDYIPTFTMWYGEKTKKYSDVDKLMSDKFFDGSSLTDILTEIDVWF